MPIARLAIALTVLAACSHPARPDPAAPAQPAPGPAASAPAAAPAPAPDAPLTEPECAQLINHIVDVGMDIQRKTKKPEEVPTEDQVAKIRAQMIHSMTPDCLRFHRASWTCAMAASTEDGLNRCTQDEPGQAAP